MAESINGSDHGILKWDTPTRVPPNEEPSLPDVSLAAASLITSCSWQTLSTLSSYHLPILIRLQMKTTPKPGLRQTYVNLKKAIWDRYSIEVQRYWTWWPDETTSAKETTPRLNCQDWIKTSRNVYVSINGKKLETLLRTWTIRQILPSCGELSKELTAEQNARQRTKLSLSTESRSHRSSS